MTSRHADGTFKGKSEIPFVIQDRGYRTPCWIWQRGIGGPGYGIYRPDRQGYPMGAHVYFYKLIYGDYKRGLELDHLCRNRMCVRPDHLEPVPHRVNARRGIKTVINDAEVQRVRLASLIGITNDVIASWYGVNPATISRIASGQIGGPLNG